MTRSTIPSWCTRCTSFSSITGNASQTAKALFVHRNTLNYRLQRIAEIGDMDLNDPETRLNAQVALRIHQLS